MNQGGIVDTGGTHTLQLFRVLVMGEDNLCVSRWKKWLGLQGCLVQVCRTYLEFLLYLEHEPFSLLVIFQSKENQPQTQAVFSYLNESLKGTPIIVVNQSVQGGWFSPNVECPN